MAYGFLNDPPQHLDFNEAVGFRQRKYGVIWSGTRQWNSDFNEAVGFRQRK